MNGGAALIMVAMKNQEQSVEFTVTPQAFPAGTRSVSASEPLIIRIWPQTLVAIGLGLSVAWACFLGYALALLIRGAT